MKEKCTIMSQNGAASLVFRTMWPFSRKIKSILKDDLSGKGIVIEEEWRKTT
jgi:hypothetical protein